MILCLIFRLPPLLCHLAPRAAVALGSVCWSFSVASQTAVAPLSAASATYQDRVLESSSQQDTAEDEVSTYNAEGWARSLRLEHGLVSQRGASRSLQRALAFSGFLDTPNHGALSVTGSWNRLLVDTVGGAGGTLRASGSTWRVEQRAMPLEGGWLANHSAGDISTPVASLARGMGRIAMPTSPISGVAGQWSRQEALSLNLAAGTTGLFSGSDIAGFESGSGRVLTGGMQLQLADGPGGLGRVEVATQLMEARNIPESGVVGGRTTQSAWSSFAWQGRAPWADTLDGNAGSPVQARAGGLRVQGNWLHSDSGLGGAANGLWADGAWRSESLQHSAGLFYFEPNLRWGPTVAASDLQGLYWRAEMSTRRWALGWSMEANASVTGLAGASVFGNAYGTYRIDSRNSVGTTVALRSGTGAAQSVQGRWDHTSDLGQTQWRASALRSQQARTVFMGVDQIWTGWSSGTLASSLGWQQGRGDSGAASYATWGLLSGFAPLSGLSLDASLRGSVGAGASALNAALSAVWQLQRNWSLTARLNESRGQEPQLVQVVSALTAATQTPVIALPAQRSVQLLLRFEERAGTNTTPLGGFVGAGAGRLAGTVFFDANHNGQRDASEAGVPNISVLLDKRFVARTDAQGRYEFPFVVAGQHTLQVQIDNVPLPWAPVSLEAVKTTVHVRESTTLDFPLQRDGQSAGFQD